MPQADLKVIDLLGGVVGFLREAGLVGMLTGVVLALWKGWVILPRDYARSEQRTTDAQEELAAERARNSALTATIERLSQVLEKATGGLERSVAHRIAVEEGVSVEDVMAELASKKVGPHTRLAYPSPVNPIARKPRRRPDGEPSTPS